MIEKPELTKIDKLTGGTPVGLESFCTLILAFRRKSLHFCVNGDNSSDLLLGSSAYATQAGSHVFSRK
jgi:hypothetical protein